MQGIYIEQCVSTEDIYNIRSTINSVQLLFFFAIAKQYEPASSRVTLVKFNILELPNTVFVILVDSGINILFLKNITGNLLFDSLYFSSAGCPSNTFIVIGGCSIM